MTSKEYNTAVYKLFIFTSLLRDIFYSIYSKHGIFVTEYLDDIYTRILTEIDNCDAIIREHKKYDEPILENIPKSLNEDRYEWIKWEDELSMDFESLVEEAEEYFEKTSRKIYALSKADKELLEEAKSAIEKHKEEKKENEKVHEILFSKKWKYNEEDLDFINEIDFSFIKNDKIKNDLLRDVNELGNAYKNTMYKTTVIFCGTIIEALLISALKQDENNVKFKYFEEYCERKRNKPNPPEVEKWQLKELINISEKMGIITQDVTKFSNFVRNYRNMVHIYHKQVNTHFEINQNTAKMAIFLLRIIYENIIKWLEK